MTGGHSSRFKTKEPDDNKGGFRKIKKGEGRVAVRGEVAGRISERRVKVLGGILFGVAITVPVFVSLRLFTEFSWALMMVWISLVLAHFFLIISETIIHRELPWRKWSMIVCWGTFFLWIVLGEIL